MDMVEHMPMHTEPLGPGALLVLAQWLSPAFPIGAFSFSSGLETAISAGDISDVPTLQSWLANMIVHGSVHNDVLLLAAAYRADTDDVLQGIDDLAVALATSSERALETIEQGRSFGRIVADIWSLPNPLRSYPVAVGAAARRKKLPLDATARLFAHAMISNLVSAAMRLMPLGQTQGHRVIAELAEQCNKLVNQCLGQTLDDIGGCAFGADIVTMQHETQHMRVFRT